VAKGAIFQSSSKKSNPPKYQKSTKNKNKYTKYQSQRINVEKKNKNETKKDKKPDDQGVRW